MRDGKQRDLAALNLLDDEIWFRCRIGQWVSELIAYSHFTTAQKLYFREVCHLEGVPNSSHDGLGNRSLAGGLINQFFDWPDVSRNPTSARA